MTIKELEQNHSLLKKFRYMKLPINDAGELVTDYKIITKGLLDYLTDEEKSCIKFLIDGRVKLLEEKIEVRTDQELQKVLTADMTDIQKKYFYKSIKIQSTIKEVELAHRRKVQHVIRARAEGLEYRVQKVMLRKKKAELASHTKERAEINLEILKEKLQHTKERAKIARSSSDKAEQASLIGLHTSKSEILIKIANMREISSIIALKKVDMGEDRVKRAEYRLERLTKIAVRAEEISAEIEMSNELSEIQTKEMKREIIVGGEILQEERMIKSKLMKIKQISKAEKLLAKIQSEKTQQD